MMTWLSDIYSQHPYLATLVTYWAASAFIGALNAPTATSSGIYQFFFKFTNTFVGNLLRAYSSKVEASPNFQAAVTTQNVIDGTTNTPMQSGVPVPPPAALKP